MKKAILTGATGLIGQNIIEPLKKDGYEIWALTIDEKNPDYDINWVKCNIFDEVSLKKVFDEVKPSHLMNFAWITGGDYLTNPVNKDFVKSGKNMLKFFKENGGKRAVFSGTCFEYDFCDEPIKETQKLNPTTLYAQCKNEMREYAQKFCKENGISFGWGRIFYVFGKNEKAGRLTSTIINNFKEGKEVTINCGSLVKDYMYTKDIAGAFAKFLGSDVEGCVNIATGKGISLEDYAKKFAIRLNAQNLLKIKNEVGNNPPFIVADVTRLKNEIGYVPRYDIDSAIDEILNL